MLGSCYPACLRLVSHDIDSKPFNVAPPAGVPRLMVHDYATAREGACFKKQGLVC